MFAQIEYPEKLLPEDLDNYLAKGWFRMRQTIFTTNFLHFHHQFFSAIWLRVALCNYFHDKKYYTLHKINKNFYTEIKQSATGVTAQQESLYQHYRQSVSFEISSTLVELLYGNQSYNRFNTYEVNVYDGEMLIAAGFFDLGKNSAAGISCIYHPLYKKFSLGKYLMYLKMDFCMKQHLQYFYPGYVVPGYNSFDYKLEIGKTAMQYLELSSEHWKPYDRLTPPISPLQEMVEKLKVLGVTLENKIPGSLFYYKFFEVNLDPYYEGYKLLDFPVFLSCFPADCRSLCTLIVYDVRDACYHLLLCDAVINIGFQQKGSGIFDSNLLKVVRDLLITANPGELCRYLADISANQ